MKKKAKTLAKGNILAENSNKTEKIIDGVLCRFVRKRQSRTSCRIDRIDGTATVAVSHLMSDESAEKFVSRVIRNEAKKHRMNDLRDGGKFVLCGEEYDLIIVYGYEKNLIMLQNGVVYIFESNGCSDDELYCTVMNFYRKELTKRLEMRVPYWERKTGLHAFSWDVRDLVSSWGKCNHKTKSIDFSVRLSMLSDDFLDMVIIHELGHILYNNHGSEFQKYMAVFFPEHRAVKRREG